MTTLLYGVKANSLEVAAERITQALDIKLQKRNSYERGGDYFCNADHKADFGLYLQPNIDDPGELAEPDFPQYGLLLYVSGLAEEAKINAILRAHPENFELLRVEK